MYFEFFLAYFFATYNNSFNLMTFSAPHQSSSADHDNDSSFLLSASDRNAGANEPLSFLNQLIGDSASALDLLADKTQADYLSDTVLQQKVEDHLRQACRALFALEGSTPGWASHLSYRPRITAFYTYLVGDPGMLKHDFVYDVVRGQVALLHTEAVQLHQAITTNTLGHA